MQYNGNEIYATRYMKFLFLFGRRWHLEHKLNILAERKFAVPGKITFRITAEHGGNFIEFCDAVVVDFKLDKKKSAIMSLLEICL